MRGGVERQDWMTLYTNEGSQAFSRVKMKSTYRNSHRSAFSSTDRRLSELLRNSQHFANEIFTNLLNSLQRRVETMMKYFLFQMERSEVILEHGTLDAIMWKKN